MTLAYFRAVFRQVQLDRCKRAVSGLDKFKWATIRIRTEEPDLSSMLTALCEWEESVYVKIKKFIPHGAPPPLVKHDVTVSYHDANLHHNFMNGGSVTVVLHLINNSPVDWHRKKKSSVETAMCGSECSSAQTYAEPIL